MNYWPTQDGAVDMTFWSLTYDRWVRDASGLVEAGRAFHQELEAECARIGAVHAPHPDEECHNRHVGACAEMIGCGQPEKAVILYNRWARFAGYEEIKLISRIPLLVDIGNALLQVRLDNRSFKVLKCQSPAS